MILLKGKELADLILADIKLKISSDSNKDNFIKPGLAVILVGNDPASEIYVKHKERAALNTGLNSKLFHLSKETTEQELLDLIDSIGKDKNFHGIIVQLPLPEQINEEKIIHSIPIEKDVDGFHPENVGKLMISGEGDLAPLLKPCTPLGIIELLYHHNIKIKGKTVVIVGRSNIVGKPASMLFLQEDATVTMCHSHTINLKEHTKKADILVVAIGRPKFFTKEYIKEGAVIVDIGITRMDNGKLYGDVDFESVKDKAYAITPVPGGVGPMTVAMLIKNTYLASNS